MQDSSKKVLRIIEFKFCSFSETRSNSGKFSETWKLFNKH